MFSRRVITNIRSVRFYTLGRWETNKNNKIIDTHVDWANHDHCGGEQCKLPSPNDIESETETETDNKNKDNEKERKYVDYYSPFMVA